MKITGLTPMLGAKKLQETIEFYSRYLGFERRGFYPDEENMCWASLWNGNMEIAFNLVENEKEICLNGTIYLCVEDVDKVWEQLKEKVEIAYPIKNFDYGMREFGIKDCNGYVLNIGQNIE